jgi:predicted amidohydrolase
VDIAFGEPNKNFEMIEKQVTLAANEKVDVVVLPEMWNTGYALDYLDRIADVEGHKTKETLSLLAQKFQVNIVGGSVATKKTGKFFNTMYSFNRKGKLVAEYDKAHLFKLMNEHIYLEAGQSLNMFELDGTICGGVICYDLRFPEWIRMHTINGAKVLFIPAQWPKQRIDHWRVLLQARAIENQCYIVAVNRVGNDPNNEYNGHSMVIGPWGELLLNNHTNEGIFTVTLSLEELERVRKSIPVYEDRRTDLYEK